MLVPLTEAMRIRGKIENYATVDEVLGDLVRSLPEGEVVAGHEPTKHREYREVEVAIRDAFSAAARQLEDHVRRQRGAVKTASPARR